MVRFFKLIAIFVVFAFILVAQTTPDRPFMAVISKMDAMGCPLIFLANGDPDLRNEEASNYAKDRIGKYYNINDINIYVIDTSQYEVCCELLNLPNRQYKTNFVLYFNGNASHFYFDKNIEIDFLSEFKGMGWVPAQTRLENFIKQNPYNQEAISMLFSLAVRELKEQINYAKQQTTTIPPTLNNEALDDALSLFGKTLELIVAANGFDWMSYGSAIMPLFDLRSLGNAPVITENKKLQLVLIDLLQLLERSIIQRPLSQDFGYMFWAGFATIMKNRPDPMIFLRNLSFPKNTNRIVASLPSTIAEQYSDYPKINEDGEPVVDELLTFFKSATEWMLEWDPNLDGVFRLDFDTLAIIQARTLIKLQMYSELEKHLDNTRILIKSNWPKVVDELKTNPYDYQGRLDDIPQLYRKRIDTILELPTLAQNINPFKDIFISHNFDKESFDKLHNALSLRKVYFPLRQNRSIPENSWSLFNSNVHVASGSINTLKDDSNSISEFDQLVELARKEEIKNLMALERLLRSNPDNYDLMDIYCEKAAKLLPDEELEQKILNYSRLTYTSPSLVDYSRMHNKDEWSRLASKAIREGLLKLNDVPFNVSNNPFTPSVNPWLNLSRWEDLDPQKNSIDWYTFFKDSVFWYQPYYYFSSYFAEIPEVVLIKYLNQAGLAGDMIAVLATCRAKFDWKKENCKNEKTLAN
jgi:hypothetical protein